MNPTSRLGGMSFFRMLLEASRAGSFAGGVEIGRRWRAERDASNARRYLLSLTDTEFVTLITEIRTWRIAKHNMNMTNMAQTRPVPVARDGSNVSFPYKAPE